jgi:hypothetical protein
MYSLSSNCPLRQLGFPIRKSPDQSLLTAPRGGIVVRHVLLRLLVPRHPPCALTSLTICSGDSACAPLQLYSLNNNLFRGGKKVCKSRHNLEHLSLTIKTTKGCFSNSFLSLSSFQGAIGLFPLPLTWQEKHLIMLLGYIQPPKVGNQSTK